jgi:RimJ/RimL family protein N-acetyltransferase
MVRIGLSRDLMVPWENPSAKIPISVRPLARNDLEPLLAVAGGASHQELLEVAWRQQYVDRHLDRGWVAIDGRDGTPCYVQWLLGSEQNEFIRDLGTFPLLARDQALLENAYTPVSHRGLGIMSAAMAAIAEQAEGLGARHVLTFVGEDNIASMKGCRRAGFTPYLIHHRVQKWYGLRGSNTFEELAANDER